MNFESFSFKTPTAPALKRIYVGGGAGALVKIVPTAFRGADHGLPFCCGIAFTRALLALLRCAFYLAISVLAW